MKKIINIQNTQKDIKKIIELIITSLNDKDKIYNIGANWTYKGKHKKELIIYPEDINGNKKPDIIAAF